MSTSTFDPEAFESIVIDQANEVKMTPVPEGDYTAMIDKVRIKSVTVKKGAREGQEIPILEVLHHIQDEDGKLKKLLNLDKVVVRQDIWLDVENGALAFGPNQNVGLGRIREATGLNKPGKAFTFKMLEGQGPIELTVGLRENSETGDFFNVVKGVRKPGEAA